MTQQNSFSRSRAMFAAITAIMHNGQGLLLQQFAIANLPEYKSRGKGGKHKAHGSRMHIYAKMRRQNHARVAAHGGDTIKKLLVSIPRKMWTVSAPLLMIEDFKSSTRKACVKVRNQLSFKQFSSLTLQ